MASRRPTPPSAGLKKDGAEVVYQANIDATQPDMTPDMLRARNAGAEAIVVWSTSTGMDARLFNTRARHGLGRALRRPSLDVVGRYRQAASTSRRTGRRSTPSAIEAAAMTTPASCRPRSEELVDKLKGKVDLSDTLLWWVAGGVDAINLIAKAVEETGSTVERGHHRILEQRQEISRLFRRLHLLRDRTTTAIRPTTS